MDPKDKLAPTALQRGQPLQIPPIRNAQKGDRNRDREPLKFITESISSPIPGSNKLILHDQAVIELLGGLLNDVLDEVRSEYRIMLIRQKLMTVSDATPPYLFTTAMCIKWVKAYYDRYHKLSDPECFVPGTDPPEPKITRQFKHYYNSEVFVRPVTMGRLLNKCYKYCGITSAGKQGNRKLWLLNPPI